MITFGDAVSLSHPALKVERLNTRDTPQQLFAKLKEGRENAYLLESASGPERLAEYSFIGFDPSSLVQFGAGGMEVTDLETGSRSKLTVDDPLTELRRLVQRNLTGSPFRLAGGAVGYLSYEAVSCWENIPRRGASPGSYPDLEFGIYNDGIVFDHRKREAHYYTLGESRIEEVKRASKEMMPVGEVDVTKERELVRREEFEEMVATAKEYIRDGDIFQVVLSRRKDFEAKGNLIGFYRELGRINPSPYMYYLKFGERSIVGSSPEMLARVVDRKVETFPIAGTRPRLSDDRRNAELAKELASDQKENAEHVMLVDLARNDVGKVSKYGSVSTPEFREVHQYSHVQHLVSHVTGDLREEFDSFDALRAVFPAGTVSGAPKVRAMEIIGELEPERRGPYAGAVGYFSVNGNADFAITIRTLVAAGNRCQVQAGAGIVADSVPSVEWEETEAKAAGLMKAAELSRGAQT